MEDPSRGESKRTFTMVMTYFDKDIDAIIADRFIQHRGMPNYTEYLSEVEEPIGY